ncbi:hypothetical protein ASPACDRAFT_1855135 [Aspergillus aculeatus ATCC 16872]|uniref:Uncharacterized protein n=1 Tax=Aspergillus aculeatus (strain ATCC 16872 / CBS 172.66 / WB 5094) TaxID=690307 RepID=A0A1L9WZW7_ASPA1|nr:uncharacterized protein ASPACDRAFT_1855135 [Aspergillus aculeatus ATCC 16872]OJK01802.1 hypothetical protein ASPACDRAFT_1855135 [Aspergillus aculeatus ATCC 16872]
MGTHIHLDRSRWRIVSKVNEHVFPFDREDAETFDIRPGLMRVYKQIPILGSEFNPAEEIARQANQQVPTEVKAFQRFSSLHLRPGCTPTLLDSRTEQQGDGDRVPGGFIYTIVWSIVPGIRLGDDFGSRTFWNLPREKRDLIRAEFRDKLPALYSCGYIPYIGATQNLVWDEASLRLYFVGWRNCLPLRPNDIELPFSPMRWASWGLAVAPRIPFPSPTWQGPIDSWEL